MHKISRLLILLLTLLPLVWMGCGEGEDSGSGDEQANSGGVGGTGNLDTSAGVVSAVGSITVNGVKFETNTATVVIDDENAPDDSGLRVGMVVAVRGTINPDGTSGTAETVVVSTAVSGAIETLGGGTIQILGQTVTIDDQTRFDEDTILPPSVDGLMAGDLVKVSGQLTPEGSIRATRIEKLNSGDSTLRVTGFVSALTATRFAIGTLEIDYGDAELDDFDAQPLMAGDFVEVRGALSGSGGTLVAERIKLKDQDFDDGGIAEIEGIIIAADEPVYTLLSAVGPVTFQINDLTLFDEGGAADLVAGAEVEVEGTFSNNVLDADTLEVDTPEDDTDGSDAGEDNGGGNSGPGGGN